MPKTPSVSMTFFQLRDKINVSNSIFLYYYQDRLTLIRSGFLRVVFCGRESV